MPRRPRNIELGRPYHLISRFVDRDWFIRRPDERRDYLGLLGRALNDSDWRCLAYAVMSNHIHIAAVAGAQPLGGWIRRVHSPFATSLNREYDRIGPIFVRGPKDIAVPGERVGSVIAYIHNNPVRANVVAHAAQSDWTSHRAYAGLVAPPPWLHVEEGLARAGFDAASAFDAWVRDPERGEFEEAYEQVVDEDPPSPPRARPSPAIAAAIVTATASEFGISVEQLLSSRRGVVEKTARQVAVRCASRCGLLGSDIARALQISQQAASHILTRPAAPDVKLLAERVVSRLTSSDDAACAA